MSLLTAADLHPLTVGRPGQAPVTPAPGQHGLLLLASGLPDPPWESTAAAPAAAAAVAAAAAAKEDERELQVATSGTVVTGRHGQLTTSSLSRRRDRSWQWLSWDLAIWPVPTG